ncbi:MAG: hypothetical protein AAF843_12300 [Bacteroidota bacterium]
MAYLLLLIYRMKRWLISIKYLFRDCIVYNLLFTFFGIYLFVGHATNSYVYIFWIKIMGYLFTLITYYWYRKKHLYFYHNLGFNKRTVATMIIGVDLVLTSIIFTVLNVIVLP